MKKMSKKKGLGRGLGDMGVSELLGCFNSSPATTLSTPDVVDGSLHKVSVQDLMPGAYQPRRNMDPGALEELANSIRAQGIIQPIIVRRQDDRYEIIAGERRWRAAKMAGLKEIPVVVRDLSDQAVVAIALIENIQRQDLNIIEEALALNRLIAEFDMTHQEVAKAVGRSRAAVTNILRLLKLNPTVRVQVEQGLLDMGHARAILSLDDKDQVEVANTVISQGLSVRLTEQLIQRYLHRDDSQAEKIPAIKDPNVSRLERDLSGRLGAPVDIQQKTNGKGKLVITYHSLDELDGILAHIK